MKNENKLPMPPNLKGWLNGDWKSMRKIELTPHVSGIRMTVWERNVELCSEADETIDDVWRNIYPKLSSLRKQKDAAKLISLKEEVNERKRKLIQSRSKLKKLKEELYGKNK